MEIMVKLKLKKMLVIFQILMILWPTAFALASTVNIGDTLNIERGGLGFYTIQYWSDYRDKWMYITYSRTYYTDQDGNKKIAYCMDQDLDGVGWLPGEYENYDALVREELRNDKIWQVLKNGYPNVSPQDLGVETEDDAYLATKQAVYWIIKHGNEPNAKIENIYTHFRAGETEINNQNFHINTWDTNSENTRVNQYNNTAFGNSNAMTGIVKGVDFNTGKLKMGVNSVGEQLYEPGFFTKNDKQVLDGYKLNFSRTGDTYTLTGVNKPNGEPALRDYNSNDGSNFFPLDSIHDLYKDKANDPEWRNCFFGMRYDIEFTIVVI